MQRDAPGPVELEAFARRRNELVGWLRPAGEEAIRAHISSLFASLRHRLDTAADESAMQRIFAADLADMPLFAIEAACRDFRQGKAGDGHWLPTQAEIRRAANEYARKWQDEYGELRQVIEAKVVPNLEFIAPERRARNAKWARGVAAEIAANASLGRAPRAKPLSDITPDEAESNLTRLVSEYPGRPVALSEEALGAAFGAKK